MSPRRTFANMTLTRHTTYEVEAIRAGKLHDTMHRYQFQDSEGKSYVWTTSKEPIELARLETVLTFVATIKRERDGYGFCRLSRVRITGTGRSQQMI